ncbi:IS200/IS605 family transposase [Lederbergia sp. NSJ-179]|uniref:IS200/IS605 family transposase n=1 Tax=Lederbergia sp. NSJ-179 TaxID=2931402 RepID=UPI001FD1BDDB|nr:IS200/IS605 family transposase [Lederbergia sp. NSJ-179]MCJ7840913.1 IS200/IS605 family transposase [Lederbergia sp. NSJ-179]
MTKVSQTNVGTSILDKSGLSHTKWNCMYHIVFIPKYRRRTMYGKLRKDVREIIRKLCECKGIEIVEGSVSIDHVHLCVKIPPKPSVSTFMGYLKGKSALMIFDRHPEYKKKGNRHFWARGYYVDTVGRNEEVIKNPELTHRAQSFAHPQKHFHFRFDFPY